MKVSMSLTLVNETLTRLSLIDTIKTDKVKLFDISHDKSKIIITKVDLLDKSQNKG